MQRLKEKMLPIFLKKMRLQQHLNQKEVAQELGMSSTMYCRIENGERMLQDYQLQKLATMFRVKIEKLRALNLADKISEETKKYSVAEVQTALAEVNMRFGQNI